MPFPEGTFTEKLLKHNMEASRPLVEVRPDLPAEVYALVARLMAKLPEERFQTPAELVEALTPLAVSQRSAELYRSSVAANAPPTAYHSRLPLVASRSLAGPPSGTEPLPRLLGSVQWRTVPGERLPADAAEQTEKNRPPIPAAPGAQRRPRKLTALVAVVLALLVGTSAGLGVVLLWAPSPTSPVIASSFPAATVPATHPPPKEDPPVKPPEKEPVKPPDKEPAKVEEPPLAVGKLVHIREREQQARPEVLRAALSRDGRWAFAGWGETAQVWDLEHIEPDGKRNHALELEYPPASAALAGDGSRVVIGTSHDERPPKGKVNVLRIVGVLWTPRGKEKEKPDFLRGHTAPITCVAVSPRGNYALTGSDDRTVRYWDLDAKTEKGKLLVHGDRVTCIAYSPNGKYALSGGWDKKAILWDLTTGQRLAAFADHTQAVLCATFSDDSRWLLTGGDNRVFLYDVEKRHRVRGFDGHTDRVRCLAFTPNGRHFLSGGDDERIRLWSIDEHESLKRFDRHTAAVLGVAVTSDGKYGVSLSADNTIQRWELMPDKAP